MSQQCDTRFRFFEFCQFRSFYNFIWTNSFIFVFFTMFQPHTLQPSLGNCCLLEHTVKSYCDSACALFSYMSHLDFNFCVLGIVFPTNLQKQQIMNLKYYGHGSTYEIQAAGVKLAWKSGRYSCRNTEERKWQMLRADAHVLPKQEVITFKSATDMQGRLKGRQPKCCREKNKCKKINRRKTHEMICFFTIGETEIQWQVRYVKTSLKITLYAKQLHFKKCQ